MSANVFDDPATIARAVRALMREVGEARRGIGPFFEFVMREQTTKSRVKLAPHQRVFFDFLMAHRRAVGRLPVNHTKTMSAATIALKLIGDDPTTRGLIVSKTQGQSQKTLQVVRDYVVDSRELRLVYPHIRPTTRAGEKWTQSAITVDRPMGIPDPTIRAVGMDGSVAGSRLNFILVDDLLDGENTRTQESRDNVYRWLDGEVFSRLDRSEGRAVIINTPFHPDDYLHKLEELGWATIRMDVLGNIRISDDRITQDAGVYWEHDGLRPASRDPHEERYRLRAHDPDPTNSKPLWFERFFYERGDWRAETEQEAVDLCLRWIEMLRSSTLLAAEFNRRYMDDTRDDGSAMCQIAWVEECKRRARAQGHHEMRSEWRDQTIPTFTGVDLAFRQGEHNDYTAFFTFAAMPNGERLILDVEFGRWPTPAIVDKVIAKANRFNSVVRVENNAAQQTIIDVCRQKNASVAIREHTTGRNKANPAYGVQSVFLDMRSTAWIIPNDTRGKCHPHVQKWIDECLNYVPSNHCGDLLMACLAPGALVTTARGLVPIEQVREGDLVLTHKSRFRRVTGVTTHEHDDQAVRLKASGHVPMVATLNHPVWAASARVHTADRKNRCVPADDWDFVLTEELRTGRRAAGHYLFAPVPIAWPERAETRIDLAAFTSSRKEQAWGGRWHIDADELRWRREKRYPRWLDVDEDYGLLVGLYLAEGSVGGKKHVVSFALHEREAHLAEMAARIMRDKFNADGSLVRGSGDHGVRFVCRSVLAARLFRCLGKATSKGMPWEWMSWPLSIRMAVVRGWLMGDGNAHRGKLSGVSISRTLLEQVRLTLAEAGYLSSMHAFMRAGSRMWGDKMSKNRDSWRLMLAENDSRRLVREGGALFAQHFGSIAGESRDKTNVRTIAMKGGIATKLAKADRFHYRGPVHNLHVEEDESYVAEGIAVHNSWFAREQAREWGMLQGVDPNAAPQQAIGMNLLSR